MREIARDAGLNHALINYHFGSKDQLVIEVLDAVAPRMLAWRQVVRDAVGDALDALERNGVVLPPPFSADVIACWVAEFWFGMEVVDLLGVDEKAARHRVALDAVGQLLEALDGRAAVVPEKRRAPP